MGDRYRQDKSDDKQSKWLSKRMQDNRSEARRKGKLQVPRAIISNEGSKPEILSKIAKTTAALSGLQIIWRNKNISLASKVKLMRTLILSTFLYACESWTAEIERRVQAIEMRCYRRRLNISYKDHVTNEEVGNRVQNAIGVHDDLLTMVKKRKLRWYMYGHISRSSGMAKTILQGTVNGARRRGRQKKWGYIIKEWTEIGFGDSLRAAEYREGGKGIVATSSVVPRPPPWLRDWDETEINKVCNVSWQCALEHWRCDWKSSW